MHTLVKEHIHRENIYMWLLLLILVIVFLLYISFDILIDAEKIAKNKEQTVNHLLYVANLCTKYNIKYWLMHDSLLQLKKQLKDKSMIVFGIYANENTKIDALNVISKQDNYSFSKEMIKIMGTSYWNMSFNINHNDIVVGKIICYERCTDGFIRCINRINIAEIININPIMNTIPSWFISKLDTQIIDKVKIHIPQDYEVLLEYWYGKSYVKSEINNIDKQLSFLTNYVSTKNMTNLKANNCGFVYKYVYPDVDEIYNWIRLNDT